MWKRKSSKHVCQRQCPPLARRPSQEPFGQALPSVLRPTGHQQVQAPFLAGRDPGRRADPRRAGEPVPAQGRVKNGKKVGKPPSRPLNRRLGPQPASPSLSGFPEGPGSVLPTGQGPRQHFHSEVKANGLLVITRAGKDSQGCLVNKMASRPADLKSPESQLTSLCVLQHRVALWSSSSRA